VDPEIERLKGEIEAATAVMRASSALVSSLRDRIAWLERERGHLRAALRALAADPEPVSDAKPV
jgi:hypothetical protein